MLLWAGLLLVVAPADGPNLAPNSGFETLTEGWPAPWSRGWARDGADAIAVAVVEEGHAGQRAVRLKHTGTQDWSLSPAQRLEVVPGDIYELSVWLRILDEGRVTLASILYPPNNNDANTLWSAGALTVAGPDASWREVRTRVLVADGIVRAEPRLLGTGPVEVLIDDFAVRRVGSLAELRTGATVPDTVALKARALEARLHPQADRFEVTDTRTGRVWSTVPVASSAAVAVRAEGDGRSHQVEIRDALTDSTLSVRYDLAP